MTVAYVGAVVALVALFAAAARTGLTVRPPRVPVIAATTRHPAGHGLPWVTVRASRADQDAPRRSAALLAVLGTGIASALLIRYAIGRPPAARSRRGTRLGPPPARGPPLPA
ncbi:MAG: hypothetical protein AUI14_17035 [Actinobacteria bacterium 13_2_20CM_2_71_6]|nr:MAG: hypothetical protein AUI14_17035 [Actinobacteria bacterium 13_2_20CM_2_71_6]